MALFRLISNIMGSLSRDLLLSGMSSPLRVIMSTLIWSVFISPHATVLPQGQYLSNKHAKYFARKSCGDSITYFSKQLTTYSVP